MLPPIIIAGAASIGLILKHRQNKNIQKWADSLGIHGEITPDFCLPDGTPLLIMAIQTNNIHAVKSLLETGFSPDIHDSKGTPALFYVVQNKAANDLLPIFIKHHANLNITNNKGETALFCTNSIPVLRQLCHSGAILDAQNIDGKTPLHCATSTTAVCTTAIITTLLNCGADTNIQDSAGKTPLHYAKSSDATKLLLRYGANPYLQDNQGKTPLHSSPNTQQIELLLKNRADPNAKDNEGKTPLFYAKNTSAALALIKAGADKSIRDNHGHVPPILDDLPQILQAYRPDIRNDNLNENLYWAVIYDNRIDRAGGKSLYSRPKSRIIAQ